MVLFGSVQGHFATSIPNKLSSNSTTEKLCVVQYGWLYDFEIQAGWNPPYNPWVYYMILKYTNNSGSILIRVHGSAPLHIYICYLISLRWANQVGGSYPISTLNTQPPSSHENRISFKNKFTSINFEPACRLENEIFYPIRVCSFLFFPCCSPITTLLFYKYGCLD